MLAQILLIFASASRLITEKPSNQVVTIREVQGLDLAEDLNKLNLIQDLPESPCSHGHDHEHSEHVHCQGGCSCPPEDKHHGAIRMKAADPKTDLIIAMVILLLTSLSAFAPLAILKTYTRLGDYLNLFAAGSIVGLCLVHIVPEAIEKSVGICGSKSSKIMAVFAFFFVFYRFGEDLLLAQKSPPPQPPALEACCYYEHNHLQATLPSSDGHAKTPPANGSFVLSVLATSIHCFVEGAFIVVSSQKWLSCFTILMHKLIVAFAFGSKVAIARSMEGKVNKSAVLSLVFFILSTPASIVFVSLSTSTMLNDPDLVLIDWLSSGLVLSIATPVLFDPKITRKSRLSILLHYLMILLSLSIISSIVILAPHDHGVDHHHH